MSECVDLLRKEKTKKILALACTKGRDGIEKMSDFERFAFVCQSLPLLVGNSLRVDFTHSLTKILGYSPDIAMMTEREVQKQLWRHFYADEEIISNLESKACLPNVNSLLRYEKDFLNKNSLCNVLDVDDILKSGNVLLDLNVVKTRENVLKYIANQNINKIFLDTDNFLYVRPNEYHAELAHQKLINGESCTVEELSLLKLWLIFGILKKEKRGFAIGVSRSVEIAQKIISRLADMKTVADISICFKADNYEIISSAAELCLEKNISSEIIFSEEIELKTAYYCIGSLLYSIPISRLSPCTFMHTEKENGIFFEALCKFVCNHAETHFDAEAYIKSIV